MTGQILLTNTVKCKVRVQKSEFCEIVLPRGTYQHKKIRNLSNNTIQRIPRAKTVFKSEFCEIIPSRVSLERTRSCLIRFLLNHTITGKLRMKSWLRFLSQDYTRSLPVMVLFRRILFGNLFFAPVTKKTEQVKTISLKSKYQNEPFYINISPPRWNSEHIPTSSWI